MKLSPKKLHAMREMRATRRSKVREYPKRGKWLRRIAAGAIDSYDMNQAVFVTCGASHPCHSKWALVHALPLAIRQRVGAEMEVSDALEHLEESSSWYTPVRYAGRWHAKYFKLGRAKWRKKSKYNKRISRELKLRAALAWVEAL